MNKDINFLVDLVAKAAGKNEDKYPVLKNLSEEEQQLIVVLGHSQTHLSMVTGKIGKIIHDADHSGQIYADLEKLKAELYSTLFTLCVFAKTLNMKGEDLISGTADLANSMIS